ncbi:MAG: hypothetical protein QXH20_00470 [Candidatus Bathyarchaeia archaeon]
MPRRSQIDKNPEIKREVVKNYRQGKTFREIEEEIKIRFPSAQTSKSAIHRFIQKVRPILHLRDAGILSDEDLDMLQQSQEALVLAHGLLTEMIAEWVEKGEVEQEKVRVLTDLLATASSFARSAAYAEKTKTQLVQHTETVLRKIIAVLSRHLDAELVRKVVEDLRNEL